MTAYGFYPSAAQDTFVPDQLIAGSTIRPATHTDTLAGGQGVLTRGTVLGRATSGANAGSLVVSVATATDGSQNPTAILVDQVDTTAGPSTGGLYMTGEFNIDYLAYDSSWTPTTLFWALRPLAILVRLTPVAGDIV